jgi:NhaP-type Na+/H+ or K+/H+ antiporter
VQSEGILPSSEPKLNGWGWGDKHIQETTRIIVGIQVFTVGVELPKFYFKRHWRSVAMLLGPVMAFGWIVCAVFCHFIFHVDVPTAMVISACLTPTDPVLAASILSNSQFSNRVPKRLKDMLSAESGCNDGISFPFLYIGLYILTQNGYGAVFKEWALITLLWQCTFGIFIGLVIGTAFNRVLRISHRNNFIDEPGFTVFYLLLAVLSVGVGSTLGSDDFLVAFGAGYGFARDGWFAGKTKEAKIGNIIDLLINSAMFVYVGTLLPFQTWQPGPLTPWINPGRLIGFLVLVLCFRRLPVMLALYRWIPDIKTFREAMFCGHFGPMGLGALFLAIEARAVLENGTSEPEDKPPAWSDPPTRREMAIETVWPVVCFTVFGSTMIHGLSVLVLSIVAHFKRAPEHRSGILAAETDPLEGMEHEHGDGSSADEDESDEEENNERTALLRA